MLVAGLEPVTMQAIILINTAFSVFHDKLHDKFFKTFLQIFHLKLDISYGFLYSIAYH